MSTYDKVVDALKKCDTVVFAYLFGSQAKGDATPRSDVDIAVYLREGSNNFDEKLHLHHQLQKKLRRDVDLIVLNSIKNFDLLDDILREGIVVKETNEDARMLFELNKEHEILDYKAFKKSIDVA